MREGWTPPSRNQPGKKRTGDGVSGWKKELGSLCFKNGKKNKGNGSRGKDRTPQAWGERTQGGPGAAGRVSRKGWSREVGWRGRRTNPPRCRAPRSPRAFSRLRDAGLAAPGGLRRRPRHFQLLEPPAFPGCWPFLTSRGPATSLFRSLMMTVGAHPEVQGHLLSHDPELDHLQSAFAATGPRTGTDTCSGDPILSAAQTGGDAASAQGPLLMEN